MIARDTATDDDSSIERDASEHIIQDATADVVKKYVHPAWASGTYSRFDLGRFVIYSAINPNSSTHPTALPLPARDPTAAAARRLRGLPND